jgi:hypothetical protein
LKSNLTYPFLAALAGASLLMMACGQATPPPATRAAAPAPIAAPAATPTPAPVIRESIISNLTLESFTVPVGAKVTWVNRDVPPHTTTAGAPGTTTGPWDSPVLNTGDQFSFTFTQAGAFPYWCRVHPQMTGTVTVR